MHPLSICYFSFHVLARPVWFHTTQWGKKFKRKVLSFWLAHWQTRTIQYRRRLTGRLKWPGGLWKFLLSSLPYQRGRALALWRLNRAWLGMSKLWYLKKKQGHFKLTGIEVLTANKNKGRCCIVPFTKDKKRLERFNVIGPKLFNNLPKELRNMKCLLEDFKINLDTFLMCVPDEPPCPGLVPGATDMILSKPSNSLLHQVQRACREGLLSGWRDQIKIWGRFFTWRTQFNSVDTVLTIAMMLKLSIENKNKNK